MDESNVLATWNWSPNYMKSDLKVPLYIKENKHSILLKLNKVLKIIWIFWGCIDSLLLWDGIKCIWKYTYLINIYIECELMTKIIEGRDLGLLTLFNLNTSYFMALLIIYNTSLEWMNYSFWIMCIS